MDITVDIAERITASERAYEKLAREAYEAWDMTKAARFRGRAEGLAMARDHVAEACRKAKADI